MSKLERRITTAAVVIPFAGFVLAIVLLWGGLVSGRDLAIFAVMYALVGFGITIGFHRLLTHRSFETSPVVRGALAILGSMSLQGAVIHWVADHRKHHTFADEKGDPHSPHTHDGEGWRAVLGGMWHSHTGWLFDRDERASARRYARDLREDPVIRFVDRYFLVWVLLGLFIPFLAGFALSGGELTAGLTAMVWGGLVRIFLLHHATWSVNSICHIYGKRPFETDDQSVPDLRPARPEAAPVRPVLRDHLPDGAPRTGAQREAPPCVRRGRQAGVERTKRTGHRPRRLVAAWPTTDREGSQATRRSSAASALSRVMGFRPQRVSTA